VGIFLLCGVVILFGAEEGGGVEGVRGVEEVEEVSKSANEKLIIWGALLFALLLSSVVVVAVVAVVVIAVVDVVVDVAVVAVVDVAVVAVVDDVAVVVFISSVMSKSEKGTTTVFAFPPFPFSPPVSFRFVFFAFSANLLVSRESESGVVVCSFVGVAFVWLVVAGVDGDEPKLGRVSELDPVELGLGLGQGFGIGLGVLVVACPFSASPRFPLLLPFLFFSSLFVGFVSSLFTLPPLSLPSVTCICLVSKSRL
jgi:hypothetical protein